MMMIHKYVFQKTSQWSSIPLRQMTTKSTSALIERIEPEIQHLPTSPAFSRLVKLNEHSRPMIYISGTGASNDIGGKPREGSATEETKWSLENISKILEASNSNMESIVSVTMLLTDKNDYDEVNREYVKHFPKDCLPSRSTALWGVPTTAKVAFSCVAVGSSKME
jgi:2-iminobutanoate/2-iminopropanoate deaminase